MSEQTREPTQGTLVRVDVDGPTVTVDLNGAGTEITMALTMALCDYSRQAGEANNMNPYEVLNSVVAGMLSRVPNAMAALDNAGRS